jgi:polygalacturonase
MICKPPAFNSRTVDHDSFSLAKDLAHHVPGRAWISLCAGRPWSAWTSTVCLWLVFTWALYGRVLAGQPEKDFDITQCGAIGDCKTLNTKAIQSAIDRCANSGGGVVVVPRGVFITGSIFLKQGVDLCVQPGGVLKGSQDTNDYPQIDTRIAGLEMKWPAALINASNMSGLKITGEGTIDGSGLRWWTEYWEARAKEPDHLDPHFKVPRPRLIHIYKSRNVLVRDLWLKDSAFWNLQLTYCDGVEVHNLKVRAPHTPVPAASSDGIDIDSTRNVLITGCDIECDDDGICLKSGRDADGLRVNLPTENVIVRDCHVGHAAGLVVFGSETSGSIRHVQVFNCKADNGCSDVVRFKSHLGRGGVVEDVLYQDIVADGVREVFNCNLEANGGLWLPEQFRTPVSPEKGIPVFRNIVVRNLKATNVKFAASIVGLPESPIQGITLDDVDIVAERGFTIRNASGLRFNNVRVNGVPVLAPKENQTGG